MRDDDIFIDIDVDFPRLEVLLSLVHGGAV